MGEHGIEQVALHVEVGEGILVEHLGILSREHVLLDGVALLVSLEVQVASTIERRDLKEEAPLLGLLGGAHNLTAHHQLGLDHHLSFQVAVVHADMVVGRTQRTEFYIRERAHLSSGIVVGTDNLILLRRLLGKGIDIVLLFARLTCQHAYAILPTIDLVRLDGI